MLSRVDSGGMTPGRGGLTLAERSAMNRAVPAAPGVEATAGAVSTVSDASPRRVDPVGVRHCWVTGLAGAPARCPGLLAEWRQDTEAGGWQGRVVYAVDEGGSTVLVEAWVDARHLQPATD